MKIVKNITLAKQDNLWLLMLHGQLYRMTIKKQ